MKICRSCKKKKHDKSMATRRGMPVTWCLVCKAKYDKSFYHNGDKAHRLRLKIIANAKRRELLKDFLRKYLLKHPCVDCGESDAIVLEFDHRDPKLKVLAVSDMRRLGWSMASLRKEVKKCDVRCANCHRRRTHRQFKYQGLAQK